MGAKLGKMSVLCGWLTLSQQPINGKWKGDTQPRESGSEVH